MIFLLNELSLHNQFQSEADFIESLKVVVQCRNLLIQYRYALNCGRATLGERQIVEQKKFRKVIGNLADKGIQRVVLQWIDKNGPFWDDNKSHSADEYFANKNDEPITNTELAEAAFNIYQGVDSSFVSFSPSDYLFTPVTIQWHRSSNDIIDIQISNYWQIQVLEDLLKQLEAPIQSWVELVEYINSHFNNLTILPDFQTHLNKQPFSHVIADQVITLLSAINELKACFDEAGHRTKKGDEIIANFFTGERARFSDESSTNKIGFKKDLTFKKEDGTDVFCSFHGKISYLYYRLHISWPVTKDDPLYVAYLGPKITKE